MTHSIICFLDSKPCGSMSSSMWKDTIFLSVSIQQNSSVFTFIFKPSTTFSLHKPSADDIARQICGSLKEQKPALTTHHYGVSVALPAGLCRMGWPNIDDPVDLVCVPILPCKRTRQHDPLFVEIDGYRHIHLELCSRRHSQVSGLRISRLRKSDCAM